MKSISLFKKGIIRIEVVRSMLLTVTTYLILKVRYIYIHTKIIIYSTFVSA